MAEEKIKKLKKRNSELVSIARQLEDKAKKLQEEKVAAQVCVRNSSYSYFYVTSEDHWQGSKFIPLYIPLDWFFCFKCTDNVILS